MDTASLSGLLAPFGTIDDNSIVMSLKPSPPKKPKRVTALVPFKQIGGAFAAVCASGRKERGLEGVEVDWAEGKEPELIGWLKKTVHLGGETKKADGEDTPTTNLSLADYKISCSTPAPAPPSNGAFSSFPSTFVRTLSLVHAL